MEWLWDGHTFGDGTSDVVQDVQVETPARRGQVDLLPQNHGAVAGDDFAGTSQVQLDLLVSRTTQSAAWQAWLDWRDRMQVTSVDGELRWAANDGADYLMFVRPEPLVAQWLRGMTRFKAKARWEAADPAIYSGTLSETTLEPYVGTSLASYPATWPALGSYPKLYGSGGTGGGVTVTNDGNWESWPTFLIAGPSSGTMSVTSLEDVTNGEKIEFTADGGLSVPSGSTLVVETHPARRAVAFTDGASRMSKVVDLDSWFPIVPGESELRFRAGGTTTGATATVQHRSAWL